MAQGRDQEKIVYVGDSRVKDYKRENVPLDYSAYPGKSEAFVPNFLLKEWMVGAVVLVGYMALVIFHPSPLGYPADPNNTDFIPMPDWYFLFMYQLLKYPYLAEDFIALGTVGIPGLAFGALLLAPFLDRGKERRWFKRPVASGLMFVAILAIVYLTNVSWTYYQNELDARNMIPEHIERAQLMEQAKEDEASGVVDRKTLAIVDPDHAGATIYEKATCLQCHAADLRGGAGPSLRGIGEVYSQEELMDIIRDGIGGMGPQIDVNAGMGVSEADLELVAEWLALQVAPEGVNVRKD